MSKRKVKNKIKEVVSVYSTKESKKADPLGSWTGTPENKNEKPVQDADDL